MGSGISRNDIEQAAARIGTHVRETPVIELRGEPGLGGRRVCLKLEFMQHSGSFKARGAFNRMLAEAPPTAGVIAASGGNHGAAVAYAARELGVRAEIFVPRPTPLTKVQRLRAYAATVTQVGESYAEAFEAMGEHAARTGAMIVHAYDQVEVVAGQGTLARELKRQATSVDAVFVAVGGGGLIAGIAAWYAGKTPVIAVEPATCATLHEALRVGKPVDVSVAGIASDSLGARRVGALAFEAARRYVADSILVSDEQILQARRWLWDSLRIATEAGGAAAMAGLLYGDHRLTPDARVAVILCGGNTDLSGLG